MYMYPSIVIILQFLVSLVVQDRCVSLSSNISIPDTTITSATRHPASTRVITGADPTCFTHFLRTSADMCRVTGVTRTSATSSVDFEMWLPDDWYGRFLVTGNGGLGGCKL